MYRPLGRRKFRELRRLGFLVPNPTNRWTNGIKLLGEVLRHPLALVIASFLCTGLIGTALQSRFQKGENSKAAITKSMNDYRNSLAAMGSAFDNYSVKSHRLLFVMQHEPNEASISKAVDQYDEAYAQWLPKLDEAAASIVQFFPSDGADASAATHYIVTLGVALSRFNDCISNALGSPGNGYENYHPAVQCRGIGLEPAKPAYQWIYVLDMCARFLPFAMRPDPGDDFDRAKQIAEMRLVFKRELQLFCNDKVLGLG